METITAKERAVTLVGPRENVGEVGKAWTRSLNALTRAAERAIHEQSIFTATS